MERFKPYLLFVFYPFGISILTLLPAWVVYSLSRLYKIDFVANFSFIQIYGLLVITSFVIGVLGFNKETLEDYKTLEDSFHLFMEKLYFKALSCVLFWLFAWIMYYMISSFNN